MNLNLKKIETESILVCKKGSFDKSTDTGIDSHPDDTCQIIKKICERIDLHQENNAAEERTLTICEEQAKADIYLPDIIYDGSKKRHKCPDPTCTQSCTKRSNLRRHIQRVHDSRHDLMKQVSTNLCITCMRCQQKFSHTVHLKSHLAKVHDLKFDEQEYTFADSNEFLKWKEELQKRTDSVYIKQTGEVRRNGKTFSYFKCNRSGHYKPKLLPTDRKRRSKAYETVKMNSHCTSVMKLVHGMQGEITVFFCATHYGHDGFNECREAVMQTTFLNPRRNRKVKKADDSKMIGRLSSVTSNIPDKQNSNISDTQCIPNSPVASIAENSIDSKSSLFLCSDTTTLPENVVDLRTVSLFNDGNRSILPRLTSSFSINDKNALLKSQDYSDYPCPSSNSSAADTEQNENVTSPTDDHQPTSKRRLISNLQKLIHVIENCQSNVILDLVANGVEKLVDTFTPLIEGQNEQENIASLMDDT